MWPRRPSVDSGLIPCCLQFAYRTDTRLWLHPCLPFTITTMTDGYRSEWAGNVGVA